MPLVLSDEKKCQPRLDNMHMAKVLLDLPYRASRYSKQRVSLNFKFSYVKRYLQISAFYSTTVLLT